MNENEIKKDIKKDNKKALPFFIGIIVVGFIVGFTSSFMQESFSADTIASTLQNGLITSFQYIGPFLIPISCILLLIPAHKNYKTATNLYEKLRQADEEELQYDIDNHINKANILIEANSIFTAFVCGVNIWAFNHQKNLPILMVVTSILVISVILSVGLSKKLTELNRLCNPHYKISVFEGVNSKFRKMYEYSDECEKALMGKAAFKAMTYTTYALIAIFVLSLSSILFFNTGLVLLAVSSILILILEITFIRETNKANQ